MPNMTSALVPTKPIIYLNNAVTTWPKPPEVQAAITQYISFPVYGSGRTPGTRGRTISCRHGRKILLSWPQTYPNEGLAVKPNSIKKIF